MLSTEIFHKPETKKLKVRPSSFVEGYARKVFPEKDEYYELLKRALLKGLRGEEETKLQEALAGREKPVRLEVIKIYGGEKVSIGPEDDSVFLLTNELNGCQATVWYEEKENGDRQAALIHFPPFMEERALKKLRELTSASDGSGQKKIFILAQEKRADWIPGYVNKIKEFCGSDLAVVVEKYNNEGQPDDGVLLVKVPPAEKGSVSIYTSHGRTKL